MTDITTTFVQHVHSAKGGGAGGGNLSSPLNKRNIQHILHPTKKPPFVSLALEIMKSIDELRQFLRDHRMEYLDSAAYLSVAGAKKMTDEQRNEIDNEAHTIIEKCHMGIGSLEKKIAELNKDKRINSESAHHHAGVVDCLKQKLSEVASYFRMQKRERLKRRAEEAEGFVKYNNVTKLKKPSSPSTSLPSSPLSRLYSVTKQTPTRNNSNNSIASILQEEEEEDEEEDIHFEEGEKRMLEEENLTLQRDLDSMVDQMKIVDTQLASVGQLFDELSFHVSAQTETVATIHKLAVEATQKVSMGNKELITATKRGVDFRVMVLLFLVVCSLALLFLNWYED